MTDAAYPFQDAALSTTERVDDLLGRLTVEEKAGQLTQYFYLAMALNQQDGAPADGEDANTAQRAMVEKAIKAGRVGSLLFVNEASETNRLQKLAIEHHRFGIPLIFGYDVIHGLRTIFPVPLAMAASWDPDSASAAQRIAAREARSVGIHWAFAPMVDIARDPRWGRIIEGAGEDPYLGGAMAAGQVAGFQGGAGADDAVPGDAILAGPKHFAGYGAARGGRDYEDVDLSDSELHNVYLPPFRDAVAAGARNIMSAYMDLNGVPASGNKWLLTDTLRDEFGFKGFVVSDANAVHSLTVQHFAKDLPDAGARAVNAGLDMEMAMFEAAYEHLPEAVEDGRVSMEVLDEAVRRVLRAKFDLGLFEHPYVDEGDAAATLSTPEHRDAAQHAAERTFVLLKNEHSTLPLKADKTSSIAVIGELANARRDPLGPWCFKYDIDETVTILDGIRQRAGQDVNVEFEPGAGVGERLYPSMFDDNDAVVDRTPEDWDDDAHINAAVELAARSGVAVVVIGQHQNQIGEKASVSTLELQGRQLEQLQRLAETGTPLVVLCMSARPLDLTCVDSHEGVGAIMQIWYPGTRAGAAVAAALFGDVSPAGRLPITWPRNVGQVPMVYNHYRTFQPEGAGERYFNEPSTPLYPFGYGLSYASFEYSNPRLDRDQIRVGETATLSVDVTNTGDVDADEVAQLYIHQCYGTSSRPLRELKGFSRVSIPAGETVTVTFPLGPDQLRYWSAVTKDWVQDATRIELYVGGDSNAPLAGSLTVTQ